MQWRLSRGAVGLSARICVDLLYQNETRGCQSEGDDRGSESEYFVLASGAD